MVKNIKRRIKSLGKTEITRAQSTIYIAPLDEFFDADEAIERLKRCLALPHCAVRQYVKKDFEDIKSKSIEYLDEVLSYAKTFKGHCKKEQTKVFL